MAGLPTRCVAFSMPSYTPVHLADYARVLRAMPRKPGLVIVPFNIRCLSPQWSDNPKYQQLDHRDVIRRFLEDPLGPVPGLAAEAPGVEDPEAAGRFRAIKVSSRFTQAVTVAELEDRRDTPPTGPGDAIGRTADLLAYHYGLDPRPGHPSLGALSDLVHVLNESGVQVLIYATPVNVELGGVHLGEAFLAALGARVADARDASRAGGEITFADLHALCPASEFLHPDYVVEHLNQDGRRRLADKILTLAAGMLVDR